MRPKVRGFSLHGHGRHAFVWNWYPITGSQLGIWWEQFTLKARHSLWEWKAGIRGVWKMAQSHGFTQSTHSTYRREWCMEKWLTAALGSASPEWLGQCLDITRTTKALLHLSTPTSSSLQRPVWQLGMADCKETHRSKYASRMQFKNSPAWS